jgi:hypothetical protein
MQRLLWSSRCNRNDVDVDGIWRVCLRPLIPVFAVASLAMKPGGKRDMIRSP